MSMMKFKTCSHSMAWEIYHSLKLNVPEKPGFCRDDVICLDSIRLFQNCSLTPARGPGVQYEVFIWAFVTSKLQHIEDQPVKQIITLNLFA